MKSFLIFFPSFRYISLPAFSWDAMLERTKIELELLSQDYFTIEESIRQSQCDILPYCQTSWNKIQRDFITVLESKKTN